MRCADDGCGYEADDCSSPAAPGLLAPEPGPDGAQDLFSARIPAREDITVEDLPHCPRCGTGLLRPAVVWFGEGVPEDRAERVEAWLRGGGGGGGDNKVDLMLVVGTSAMVRPASGYIARARELGARVAFFNMEAGTAGVARPEEADWSFVGDAAELLPLALKGALLGEQGEGEEK